jgi:hypothetical protein
MLLSWKSLNQPKEHNNVPTLSPHLKHSFHLEAKVNWPYNKRTPTPLSCCMAISPNTVSWGCIYIHEPLCKGAITWALAWLKWNLISHMLRSSRIEIVELATANRCISLFLRRTTLSLLDCWQMTNSWIGTGWQQQHRSFSLLMCDVSVEAYCLTVFCGLNNFWMKQHFGSQRILNLVFLIFTLLISCHMFNNCRLPCITVGIDV